MKRILASAGALCAAAAAYGFQPGGWDIVVSNKVTPQAPETEIEVWAWFDPEYFAFGGAGYSVIVNAGGGWFTSAEELLGHPAGYDGTIQGEQVFGIISGTFCMWGWPECPDVLDNPILSWRGIWTTDDFQARTAPVITLTTEFFVYLDGMGNNTLIAPTEGAALLFVGSDCYADFNADGELNVFDFLAYVNAFNSGDMIADCNGCGCLNLFSFLCFIEAFNAGC